MPPSRDSRRADAVKLKQRGSLTEAELRSILPQRQLARVQWRRLTLSFDNNRGLFDFLQDPAIHWPKGAIRNPFLAALHRLRHAGATDLPLRHRQALAALDEPMALARLALEEANTRAWRHLDSWPLVQMKRWLMTAPFGQRPEAVTLWAQASTYLAYYLPREGDPLESFNALAYAMQAAKMLPTGHPLVFVQMLASALGWAPMKDEGGEPHASSALLGAELWLSRRSLEKDPAIQTELPELRAELALVRGSVLGLRGSFLEAEAGYREALKDLPPDTDPFLRLLLLQEAGGAVINSALAPLEISGFAIGADLAASMASREHATELAETTLAALAEQRETFERAGELLATAEPLLATWGHPEQKLRQRWLQAHVRQIADPAGALLDLIAVFKQARSRGFELMLAAVAADLMLLLPRLRAIPEAERAKVLLRFHPLVAWLVAVFDRYNADPAPPLPSSPAAAGDA